MRFRAFRVDWDTVFISKIFVSMKRKTRVSKASKMRVCWSDWSKFHKISFSAIISYCSLEIVYAVKDCDPCGALLSTVSFQISVVTICEYNTTCQRNSVLWRTLYWPTEWASVLSQLYVSFFLNIAPAKDKTNVTLYIKWTQLRRFDLRLVSIFVWSCSGLAGRFGTCFQYSACTGAEVHFSLLVLPLLHSLWVRIDCTLPSLLDTTYFKKKVHYTAHT